jgi:hypothetical protein
MSARVFLPDRRHALEEAFLRRASPGLRSRLRGRRRRSREESLRACGIGDREILDGLVRLGVAPESLAALGLVPLLAVAWARGRVEPDEREAWLTAAAKCGIDEETPAHELLSLWLVEPPDRTLFEAWTRFAKALCDHLDDARRERLRAHLVQRARSVARAAGRSDGVSLACPEEERELTKLAQAF